MAIYDCEQKVLTLGYVIGLYNQVNTRCLNTICAEKNTITLFNID